MRRINNRGGLQKFRKRSTQYPLLPLLPHLPPLGPSISSPTSLSMRAGGASFCGRSLALTRPHPPSSSVPRLLRPALSDPDSAGRPPSPDGSGSGTPSTSGKGTGRPRRLRRRSKEGEAADARAGAKNGFRVELPIAFVAAQAGREIAVITAELGTAAFTSAASAGKAALGEFAGASIVGQVQLSISLKHLSYMYICIIISYKSKSRYLSYTIFLLDRAESTLRDGVTQAAIGGRSSVQASSAQVAAKAVLGVNPASSAAAAQASTAQSATGALGAASAGRFLKIIYIHVIIYYSYNHSDILSYVLDSVCESDLVIRFIHLCKTHLCRRSLIHIIYNSQSRKVK